MEENTTNQISSEVESKEKKKLFFSKLGIDSLHKMANWSAFISVVGFLITLLSLTVGIFATFIPHIFLADNQNIAQEHHLILLISGIMFLVLAILFFLPSLFLFHSSRNIRKGIIYTDQESFDKGLFNLKRVSIFMGILMLVFLAYVIFTITTFLLSYTIVHYLW